jgi:uncharacterized protein YjbI with pentapeptide repeats
MPDDAQGPQPRFIRWRWPDWGFGEKHWPEEPGEVRRAKTLWDWLQLLVVPAILILVVALWNASQTSRDKSREDDARQAATLTAYLSQMSDLILERDLLGSEVGSPVRAVARSVTLTTLRRVGAERKGAVIRFLYESHLLRIPQEHNVYLNGADLSGANLAGAQLRRAFLGDINNARLVNVGGANLAGANLRDANLSGANLGGADLTNADLRDADLRGANLGGAHLMNADLRDADLRGAVLGAELMNANLSHAQLRGANLSAAKLKDANLRGADLKGAYWWLATGLDLDRYISVLPLAERKVFLDSEKMMLDSMSRETLATFELSPEELAKFREEANGPVDRDFAMAAARRSLVTAAEVTPRPHDPLA